MTEPARTLGLYRSRTWAEVDLDALAHNIRALRMALPARTACMAVVKADAYGHGAVPVAQTAVAAGATWLGVATAEEALELRAAGLTAPTLIFGPVPAEWLEPLVAAGCSLTVADWRTVEALRRTDGRHRPRVHIKVDTGMTRLGFAPAGLAAVLDAVASAPVAVEGVYTHLASADDPDPEMTRRQMDAFTEAARLTRSRFPSALCHAAASAATLAHPDAAFDLARLGIAMYGAAPAPHLATASLQSVMTLSSRVVRVQRVAAGTPVSYGATYRAARATTIATVPVGYADGYPRALSGRGVMLIDGRRRPVAGRVCMDYTMLDAGDVAVREGDEATVFGPGLPAVEVAATAQTIAHELFCRIGRRVPRIYTRAGRPVAVAPEAGTRIVEVGNAG